MYDYEYIGEKLTGDTATWDLAGTRIFHGEIPETEITLPVISYQLVSRPNILQGAAERPRYTINNYAATAAEAMNLAHAVHGVFNNRQETVGGFDVQNTYFDNSLLIRQPDNTYNCPVDIFLMYINE